MKNLKLSTLFLSMLAMTQVSEATFIECKEITGCDGNYNDNNKYDVYFPLEYYQLSSNDSDKITMFSYRARDKQDLWNKTVFIQNKFIYSKPQTSQTGHFIFSLDFINAIIRDNPSFIMNSKINDNVSPPAILSLNNSFLSLDAGQSMHGERPSTSFELKTKTATAIWANNSDINLGLGTGGNKFSLNANNTIAFDLNNSVLTLYEAEIKTDNNSNELTGFTLENSRASIHALDMELPYKYSAGFELDGSRLELLGWISSDKKYINVNVDTAFLIDSVYRKDKENEPYNNIYISNSNILGKTNLVEYRADKAELEKYSQDELNKSFSDLYAKDSQLFGKITSEISENADDEWTSNLPVNIDLTLKNTKWTLNGNSELRNLNADNKSSITFEKQGDKFSSLTINNDLNGNAVFHLNTDLEKQQADKIIVKGTANGQHKISIKNSGDEPNAPNGKVTLVETQTGEAQFSLLNREYVDAGAYRYRLNKEGTNWVLSNHAGEKTITTPEVPTEPSTPETPTEPNNTAPQPPIIPPVIVPPAMNEPANPQRALSEKSNALVSLRQAQLHLVEQGLTDLHHRLGELKRGEQGNVWVKNVNSRSKLTALSASSNSQTSGFEQDIHSLQLGADVVLSNNFRLGGFIGNARSDVDFNNDYGSGKVKGQSFGLYGTYLADNGFYWDNIAKYDRLKAENHETGKRKYHGYTLSTEVGRIHTLGAGWTITPQLQFAWTTLSGQSDEDRLNAYTGRAGVRVAKTIGFNGWNMQPYAEINGVKTKTRHNQVRVNQYAFDVAETGSRFESSLGLNAQFGQHRFGLEGGFTSGKKLDQPYKVQLTYRYSW